MGRSRRGAGKQLERALERAVREGYQEGLSRGLAAALRARSRELLQQDYTDARSILKDAGFEGAPKRLGRTPDAWKARWHSAFETLLEEVMGEATSHSAEVLGNLLDLSEPRAKEVFDDYLIELSGEVTETTRQDVLDVIRKSHEEGISVSEASQRIQERSSEIGESRADLIARTELARASNKASWLQALQSGVVKTKKWQWTKDGKTRHEHRPGSGVGDEEVPIEDEFSNGLQHPGEPNCRCSLSFSIDLTALQAS